MFTGPLSKIVNWTRRLARRTAAAPKPRRRQSFRPGVEALEDRWCPAVSLVQNIGTGVAIGASSAANNPTSLTINVSSPDIPVAVGDRVIVEIGGFISTLAGTVTSVTDSAGNTYNLDAMAPNTAGYLCYIFSAPVTTAIPVGGSITAHFMSNLRMNDEDVASAFDFSGVGAPDQSAGTPVTTSTTPNSGTTPTTTQANELLIGALGATVNLSAPTLTAPGNSYTALTPSSQAPFGSQAAGTSILPEYRVVSTTGTYFADGTLNTASQWVAAIATYKALATAGPAITSANAASFTAGQVNSFTVTTQSTAGTPSLTESGALPAGVTFTDNGNGTATLAGTPTVGGTSTFTITANNGNPPNATQVFTLTVNKAPTITSAAATTFNAGAASSFTITTTGGFPSNVALSESGALPGGVTFTDNGNGTATLAGIATVGGAYQITITASNGVTPSATQTFTLTVFTSPPRITSAATATFTAGHLGEFTVTTAGGLPSSFPVTLTASQLPDGLTFTDNGNGTAFLSGAPKARGNFGIQITASNGITPDTTQLFRLVVNQVAPPPAVDIQFNHGQEYVLTVSSLGDLYYFTGGHTFFLQHSVRSASITFLGDQPIFLVVFQDGSMYQFDNSGTHELSGPDNLGDPDTNIIKSVCVRANQGKLDVYLVFQDGTGVVFRGNGTTQVVGNNLSSLSLAYDSAGDALAVYYTDTSGKLFAYAAGDTKVTKLSDGGVAYVATALTGGNAPSIPCVLIYTDYSVFFYGPDGPQQLVQSL